MRKSKLFYTNRPAETVILGGIKINVWFLIVSTKHSRPHRSKSHIQLIVENCSFTHTGSQAWPDCVIPWGPLTVSSEVLAAQVQMLICSEAGRPLAG